MSPYLGKHLVEKIHHLPQVNTIYIFCQNPDRHQAWAKKWWKIQGVYNQIKCICEALRTAVKQTNENLVPTSPYTKSEGDQDGSDIDLNRLDPSFMYTTLFKRIILNMKHEPDERKAIVNFCRKHFATNPAELKIVEQFDRDYCPEKAIWWYTRECFTYQLLNRSLRLLESDIIVDMAFFIDDLHRQLQKLHQEQFSSATDEMLTVYRGQGLTSDDFANLQRNQDGLLAFNGFLSTSTKKFIAMSFAQLASLRDNMVGVLFVMTVDPKSRSAKFADISEHSYFKAENEILFSMHTVFRVHDFVELASAKRLFEVQLTLTNDDDPKLHQLTDYIDKEKGAGSGWHLLGNVLLNIGHPNKAEELYNILLKQSSSQRETAVYYHQLGSIKQQQGDNEASLKFYERTISISEEVLGANHIELAQSYNNIGGVYSEMGEYSKALSYNKRGHAIFEENLPAFHPDLSRSQHSIGMAYYRMGEYSEALSYYNKAVANQEKMLPANHPELASSYNNIGLVYFSMGKYSEALLYHKKALAIKEKSLPENHFEFAQAYDNIALVYQCMEEYSEALSQQLKALVVFEKTLPANHPKLGHLYNNIGTVCLKMEKHSEALSYFEKGLAILEKSLSTDHPDLAASYNNIGTLYYRMGEHSEALLYYQKALAISEIKLPADHPTLGTCYNNIGAAYLLGRKIFQALSYLKKAIVIREKSLPANHPDLAETYFHIGLIYIAREQYLQAQGVLQKAYEIWKDALPDGHFNTTTCEAMLQRLNKELEE